MTRRWFSTTRAMGKSPTDQPEEPADLKAVVVDVEGHPEVKVITLYHRKLGLRIQPRMPAGQYPDEPGVAITMALSDLYPE